MLYLVQYLTSSLKSLDTFFGILYNFLSFNCSMQTEAIIVLTTKCPLLPTSCNTVYSRSSPSSSPSLALALALALPLALALALALAPSPSR